MLINFSSKVAFQEAFGEASISDADFFATSPIPGAESEGKNEVLDELLQVPSGVASVADIHAATDPFYLDQVLKETAPKKTGVAAPGVGVAAPGVAVAAPDVVTKKPAYKLKLKPTTPGAEGTTATNLKRGLLDDWMSTSFQAWKATNTRTRLRLGLRPREAYLSPLVVWLLQEGLPTAEMEARDVVKALGGEMDKEAVMRRAMEKWRRMSVEEKAVWRVRAKEDAKEARAKEDANTNQK